jgi:hypothetical protein
MSEHMLKNYVVDLSSMEGKIRRRLRRGKVRLLLSEVFAFILATVVILFVL